MFGNLPLPNIAPSLLLCLPPHSLHHRLLRPSCERPHGLSKGALIADADAQQPRHVTVAYGRHVTAFRRSPRPPLRSYRPSPRRGMWGCSFPTPTPTNYATSPPRTIATSPRTVATSLSHTVTTSPRTVRTPRPCPSSNALSRRPRE